MLIVQPLVIAKNINIHPVLMVSAIIVGGKIYGVIGMLLSVPAATVTKVLISELYWGWRNYSQFSGLWY